MGHGYVIYPKTAKAADKRRKKRANEKKMPRNSSSLRYKARKTNFKAKTKAKTRRQMLLKKNRERRERERNLLPNIIMSMLNSETDAQSESGSEPEVDPVSIDDLPQTSQREKSAGKSRWNSSAKSCVRLPLKSRTRATVSKASRPAKAKGSKSARSAKASKLSRLSKSASRRARFKSRSVPLTNYVYRKRMVAKAKPKLRHTVCKICAAARARLLHSSEVIKPLPPAICPIQCAQRAAEINHNYPLAPAEPRPCSMQPAKGVCPCNRPTPPPKE